MLKFKRYTIVIFLLLAVSAFAHTDPRFKEESDDARSARAVVERVVLRAYEEVLQSGAHSEEQLTNAPISGQTDKRGRHLLSFAAFNHFPHLAQWGLDHGADINLGDKDHANMLRMSLGNYNGEMARFALENGADPNIQMGSGNDTMFSGLMKWQWPVKGFVLATEFGARPRSQKERQELLAYLNSLPVTQEEPAGIWSWIFPDHSDRREVIDYIKDVPRLKGQLPSAGTGPLISTSMIDVMDRHILAAMDSGELTDIEMDNFQVKGKGFEAFLTFNGFTRSVVKRLATMDRAKAIRVVKTLDVEGNDLLVAAIKSLNDEAVEAILAVTSETVNARVSKSPYHYSSGQRPLHMAIQWEVPYRIFALLVSNGANPGLTNSRGVSAMKLLEYYRSDWSKEPGKYEKVKSLFDSASGKASAAEG